MIVRRCLHFSENRAISNTALMQLLRWAPDRYWAARHALLDDALIERGRGQSGSVRRVPAPPESFDESAQLDAPAHDHRAKTDRIV